MQEEKRGGRTGGNGRKGRIIAFCVVIENRVSGEIATHQIVQKMLDALK